MSDLLPFQRAFSGVPVFAKYAKNWILNSEIDQIYDFFFQFFDYKNDRGDFRWEAFGLYIVLNEHGRGIIFRLNSSRRRDDAQKWKSHEVPLIYLQSGDYKWNPIDQQFFPR